VLCYKPATYLIKGRARVDGYRHTVAAEVVFQNGWTIQVTIHMMDGSAEDDIAGGLG